MAIIFRALMYVGSRHLICRYRAKYARSSVLRETLMPWLDNTIGKNGYTYLAHEINRAGRRQGWDFWQGLFRTSGEDRVPIFRLSLLF